MIEKPSTTAIRHPLAPRRASASRPFVLVNMAMSADGKIATVNRTVSTFGSKRDLEHLYELRATADAVMAGARTIDTHKVLLGPGGERFKKVRKRNGLAEYNLRIIVSGSGSIDPDAAIFQHRFSSILILTTAGLPDAKYRQLRSLADEVLVCGKNQIDFVRALRELHQKWNVQRLLCEGGGELNSALFRAGLVDELHLTICPRIFGGRRAPTIAEGEGVESLVEAARLDLKSWKQVGEELFVVCRARKRLSC